LSCLAGDEGAALRGIRELVADVVADLRAEPRAALPASTILLGGRNSWLRRSPDPQAEMRWAEERLFEQDLWHGNARA
jgi:hypothetical protein